MYVLNEKIRTLGIPLQTPVFYIYLKDFKWCLRGVFIAGTCFPDVD